MDSPSQATAIKEANTGIKLINRPARLAPISSTPRFQQKKATIEGNAATYRMLETTLKRNANAGRQLNSHTYSGSKPSAPVANVYNRKLSRCIGGLRRKNTEYSAYSKTAANINRSPSTKDKSKAE